MKGFIISMLRFYQGALSPWLGGRCRFAPSCSEFARLAVETDGVRGLGAAFRRFLRCHPLGGSGFDPYIKRSERA
jgi:putative membrane protein insertion efficiency factor